MIEIKLIVYYYFNSNMLLIAVIPIAIYIVTQTKQSKALSVTARTL